MVVVALVTLAWAAAAHPGLRFVDFLSFSNRARRLQDGQDLVHGLYPVGYPAILLALQKVVGDVLVAGKGLAVAAGAGASLAAGLLVGPGGAAWMLGSPEFLRWGSTEGTDLPAVALGLAALAAASRGRPGAAGALAGLACLCRYTGLAVVPAVLWLSPARWRTLAFFVAFTAPHWGLAVALGRSPLPSQEGNLAIGGAVGWSEALRRWPEGTLRAGRAALAGWPTWVGGLGLLIGLVRRERAALALGAWAALHVAGIGLVFSNTRLVLPTTLALCLGAGWLLPTRLRPGLLLVSAALLFRALPAARQPDPGEAALAAISAEMRDLPGPWLCTNPSFYTTRGGWLESGVLLKNLGGDPRRLSPTALRELGLARGFQGVVIDVGRVRATWPGLIPLLATQPPPGFARIREASGWRALVWVDLPLTPSPGL